MKSDLQFIITFTLIDEKSGKQLYTQQFAKSAFDASSSIGLGVSGLPQDQFLTVEKFGARFYVKAPQLKLTFRYTGDDVFSMVPASYRAQHCGLCGDYNGQNNLGELVGPSGCRLKDATDLARSYVLKDKCKDSIPPVKCVDDHL